jgi:hypothetical protein
MNAEWSRIQLYPQRNELQKREILFSCVTARKAVMATIEKFEIPYHPGSLHMCVHFLVKSLHLVSGSPSFAWSEMSTYNLDRLNAIRMIRESNHQRLPGLVIVRMRHGSVDAATRCDRCGLV